MSDIFKPVPWTVEQLVGAVSSGVLRLPDLQRPFVWHATKVRDLIDSMFRGYPVGELMFWKVADSSTTTSIGDNSKSQSGTHQIIDGQQRLTSLYATITGHDVVDDEYKKRTIRIAFNPFTRRFEVATPVYEKSPEWVSNIANVFKSPLTSHKQFVKTYEAARGEELSTDLADTLFQTFVDLDGLKKYNFTVVELQDTAAKEVVADIFVRINSEGVSLTAADFILTWMSVFWPEGRDQIENFAKLSRMTAEYASEISDTKVTWTPRNHHIAVSPGQLVRVAVAVGQNRGRLQDSYNALRGRDKATGQADSAKQQAELNLLKSAVPTILNPLHWDEFMHVPGHAGFISRKMITSDNTLLYSYALWLLGRTHFKVNVTELRDLMARWFFMAQTTGRYTNSPESRIQQDLDRLDGLQNGDAKGFSTILNGVIETVLTQDFWRISMPESFVSSSTSSSPAYQAYLAALIILDAKLFALDSGIRHWMDPTATAVKGVEGHHLFPREYLKQSLGYDDIKKINQVANFAPTDWSTNIMISDKPPSKYWSTLVAERKMAGSALARQMFWHALPSGWDKMDYEEFLATRRKLMAEVTHAGFGRLGVPAYEPPQYTDSDVADTHPIQPSILELFDAGALKPGDVISTADLELDFLAEISEDGEILLGDHRYEDPNRAAEAVGATNVDGWTFWQLEGPQGQTALADLVVQLQ